VDTGLGPKNGATVARVVAKLAPNNKKLFLTTTHFHPEHAGGEPGFAPGTILIRDTVQQQEMDKHGQECWTDSAPRTKNCSQELYCARLT
jgi:glyoxylase-like metal-dependent hydrolase (beta-lactamase superfamily II)